MGKSDQTPSGYLRQFPMLTKIEAERSGLNNIIEEIVQEGGCTKRKAELLEKDLN